MAPGIWSTASDSAGLATGGCSVRRTRFTAGSFFRYRRRFLLYCLRAVSLGYPAVRPPQCASNDRPNQKHGTGSLRNHRLRRRTRMASLVRERSCSQIRRTRQPCALNVLDTRRSLTSFPWSFFSQNTALFLGLVEWRGQECQKHPSTNTAKRSFGKTKSGFPNKG